MKKAIVNYLSTAEAIQRLLHPYAEVVVHDFELDQIVRSIILSPSICSYLFAGTWLNSRVFKSPRKEKFNFSFAGCWGFYREECGTICSTGAESFTGYGL